MATFAGVLASACSSSDSSGGSNGGGPGPSGSGCPASECKWANGSKCLAMADNSGQERINLRMSQLIVTAPKALTNQFIQTSILGANVRTNYGDPKDPANNPCSMSGTGGFSWLFSFDKATNKLTTGGGPAVATAEDGKAGTCFYQFTQDGNEVKPVQIDATLADDGTFSLTGATNVTVPIFLATGGVVLLPLNHVAFNPGSKLTDNGNCLGEYKTSLDPDLQCVPDDVVSYFDEGGSLAGYITVDNAEHVLVADLKETLCVLLSGERGETDGDGIVHCPVDGQGKPTVTGDWQSDLPDGAGMAKAGGDSWQLKASFAANAVTIKGVATKADCSDATWK